MSKPITVYGGIDTGKYKLDVALHGSTERLQVDNVPDGHLALSRWLERYGVKRIGIEASGGYEQEVVGQLRRGAFEVIVGHRIPAWTSACLCPVHSATGEER